MPRTRFGTFPSNKSCQIRVWAHFCRTNHAKDEFGHIPVAKIMPRTRLGPFLLKKHADWQVELFQSGLKRFSGVKRETVFSKRFRFRFSANRFGTCLNRYGTFLNRSKTTSCRKIHAKDEIWHNPVEKCMPRTSLGTFLSTNSCRGRVLADSC